MVAILGSPVGAAGGDLEGAYPNPLVASIDGTAFELPVTVANGGTGAATAPAALTALGAAPAAAPTFTGVVAENGGTSTAGSAPVIAAPGFANGVASQLSDLTRDYMVYVTITTAGTVFTLSIGPTSGVADAIVPSSTVSLGESFAVRLPAGWWLKWAATLATVSQIAIGC